MKRGGLFSLLFCCVILSWCLDEWVVINNEADNFTGDVEVIDSLEEANKQKWNCSSDITWLFSNLTLKLYFNSDSILSIGDNVPDVIIVEYSFFSITNENPNPGLKQNICKTLLISLEL